MSLAVVAVWAAVAAADVAPDPAGRAIEHSGNGQWGPEGAAPRPANASWLLVDGEVLAFRVTQDGTSHDCYGTTLPDARNGSATNGCGAEPEDNATVLLQATIGGTPYTGTFQATAQNVLLEPTADDGPSLVPGFIVALLAALFATTTIIMSVLYVQERRVAHYLVRRLYEETKGRLPADWPENLRQQWIARVFVRGKN